MELTNEIDFTCKKCISGVLFQDEDKMINLDGDNIRSCGQVLLPVPQLQLCPGGMGEIFCR